MSVSITVHSRILGDVSVDFDTQGFLKPDYELRSIDNTLTRAVEHIRRAYGIKETDA